MSVGKKQGNIIIRREEVVEGGHHGGAWKVAYADFVTAMMAFFLLMWLLNATTADKKRGLADYFSASNVMSQTTSGNGAPFGGRTPNIDGKLATDRGAEEIKLVKPAPIIDPDQDEDGDQPQQVKTDGAQASTGGSPGDATGRGATAMPQLGDGAQPAVGAAARTAAQQEHAAFEQAAQQLKQAVQDDPALADIAKQLAIDITPEGLRIQIIDADKQAMFATGSAVLNDRARALLQKVAPVLLRLPEPVAIAGHTDAAPYRGGDRTNWDLSADRANATRRALTDAGLPEVGLRSVTGNADRDLLLPGQPLASANRRIAITVLRTRKAS